MLVRQRVERRIGRHAVVDTVGAENDMVTAGTPAIEARAEAPARLQAYPHDRSTSQRLEQSHQHHRTEHAAARAETRAEVDDAQRAAVGVVQNRFDHGGVAKVTLLRPGEIDQVDGKDAAGSPPPSCVSSAEKTGSPSGRAGTSRRRGRTRRSAPTPRSCRLTPSSRFGRLGLMATALRHQQVPRETPARHEGRKPGSSPERDHPLRRTGRRCARPLQGQSGR